MDIFELMMQLMKPTPDEPTIEKNWIQVAKLSPADEGKKRSLLAMLDEKHRECDMHEKRIHAIKAQVSADDDEWWLHLHRTYGLPPKGNFHIFEDGRVFMEPKEKK